MNITIVKEQNTLIMRVSLLLLFWALVLTSYSCQSDTKKPAITIPTNTNPSLEKMVGQMIMVGVKGMTIEEVSPTFLKQMDQGYVGGIVLFDYDVTTKKAYRNVESPGQVKQLISDLQKHASIPLLMAVDQEGGKVNRLKSKYGFPNSVTAKYLGTLDNIDSTKYYAVQNAQTLKSLGFNVNFAPVVDIDLNPDNPVIGKYERSYSDKTDLVIKHATAWIKEQDAQGILSTLKHFPGHGSSDADSHYGITDVTKYWQTEELAPFQALSALDYQVAIMTAHVKNNQLDSIYPATLSKQVIHKILREDWQFDGLVFSDDLQMQAVNAIYDFDTILKRSIEAGVDVLVFGNNIEYDETIPARAVKAVVKMVEEGTVSRERIALSYGRIVRIKMD